MAARVIQFPRKPTPTHPDETERGFNIVRRRFYIVRGWARALSLRKSLRSDASEKRGELHAI